MTKFLPGLVVLLFPSIIATAQQDVLIQCRNNDMDLLRPLHQDDPVKLIQMANAEAELEAFTQIFTGTVSDRDDADYIIPVVFHVIHNNGLENITNAQIEDAMRVLNLDFRRLNTDWENVNPAFLDLVADARVEFRLAKRDPDGNCTTGITRTESTLTNSGEQDMKDLIQWPRDHYLNVWVSAYAGGAAGYTYRPGSVDQFPSGDGIVLLHTYTGSIGTSSPSRSRTLTHEVGHWINLAHTWGNTNDPGEPENCDEDDNVQDTPNTIGWTSCNINGSSCNSPLDNVENYMEYSYCGKMFTMGQATRMTAALNSGTADRNELWEGSNLVQTGVLEEGALCAAQFTGNGGVVCAGESITFHDQSFHNVVSRSWSFPGGDPSTSTDPDPVVIYAEPGVHPVILTVSDGSSTLTTTSEEFVKVLSVPGAIVPFFEGFEEISELNGTDWSVSEE
nr:M43 family zinc metalloprotease [Bacteroidota bacterium]